MQAQSGRMISGRYRLVEPLGSGEFSQTWRAHDEAMGVDVVVKELQPHPDAEQAARLRRAEDAARAVARLRGHPNIVAAYDIIVADDARWIVTDLVAGRSLAAQVEEYGPVPVDTAGKVAVGLLNALGAAHEAGIAHGAIKPANVLLADNGQVLLTDFGFANTPEYLAPEQSEGGDAQPASDLFSLGTTLYHAVEGFSPFRRDTVTATLRAVLLHQPPLPRRAGWLGPLLAGLMTKEPQHRPTIPAALAVVSAPPVLGPGPGNQPLVTTPRRRRPSVNAVAGLVTTAVVVAALVVAVVLMTTSGHQNNALSPMAPVATTHAATPTDTPTGAATTNATGTGSAAVPDPCTAVDSTLTADWALGNGNPGGYDKAGAPWMKECQWDSAFVDPTNNLQVTGTTLMYSQISVSGTPMPVTVTGEPSAGAIVDGSGNACVIQWPTSFGETVVEVKVAQDSQPQAVCDVAAAFASALAPNLPK